LADLIGSAGLMHPNQITPDYLLCRDVSGKITSLASQLPTLTAGALLPGADASSQKDVPQEYVQYWDRAQTSRFGLALQ